MEGEGEGTGGVKEPISLICDDTLDYCRQESQGGNLYAGVDNIRMVVLLAAMSSVKVAQRRGSWAERWKSILRGMERVEFGEVGRGGMRFLCR